MMDPFVPWSIKAYLVSCGLKAILCLALLRIVLCGTHATSGRRTATIAGHIGRRCSGPQRILPWRPRPQVRSACGIHVGMPRNRCHNHLVQTATCRLRYGITSWSGLARVLTSLMAAFFSPRLWVVGGGGAIPRCIALHAMLTRSTSRSPKLRKVAIDSSCMECFSMMSSGCGFAMIEV